MVRFTDSRLIERVESMHHQAEAKAGVRPDHHQAVRLNAAQALCR
jgi:hypothetical protein